MNPDGSVNTSGTNASLASFSYSNDYGALHPDNYAFMAKIKVSENAKMIFYAAGFDPSYAVEHFGVAVASSDGLNISTIAEWDSRNPYQAFSVDLSAYEGQEIFLGFRHFTNVSNYALCIDNITVTNAVWSGTASETLWYNIFRSTDGQNYNLIGVADGSAMHFDDNDSSAETYYYKVTAINSVAGGQVCESAYAMSADGIHDYVTAHTDGVEEIEDRVNVYPIPTHGVLYVETHHCMSLPGQTEYCIMNAIGQTILTGQIMGETQQIDVSNLPQGMYFITIEGATRKFVVK